MRKLFGHFGKKKLKKVSFDEQRLKTFVYDKDTIDGSSEVLHIRSPFTDPNAPPSRITVVAEESEMPTTIMPPAQIEDTQNAAAVSSPPLPALIKRVKNELTDNPFRPEESLFHEVDPIVEAYKRKPYPPSLPGSQNTTPIKTTNQAYLNDSGISPSSLAPDKGIEAQVTGTTPLMNSDDLIGMEDGMGDLPKARQVECIRIEKKKKRKSMKGLSFTK
ncbi:Glutathione S-transferase [Dirofilaria immitis]